MLPLSDTPDQARRHFPYVMLGLVALNVLVFLYEVSLGPQVETFVRAWAVIPAELTSGTDLPPSIPLPVYATLLTSLFLQGGLLHLGGNMIFLWVFGDNVEDRFGHFTFLSFYLAAGVAAGIAHVVANPTSRIPSLGASGAIAGVLAAYVLLFPSARIRTLLTFGPVISIGRVGALLLIGFWFALQLAQAVISLGRVTESGGVAFLAHVGGFVFGIIATGAIRFLRHQTVGPIEGIWWSPVFRNWLILVVAAGLLLGVASLLGLSLLVGLTWLAVGLLALIDGIRRVLGRESLLGSGRSGGRILAIVQLLLSLLLLGSLLQAAVAL